MIELIWLFEVTMIKEFDFTLEKEDFKKAAKDFCKINRLKGERIKISIILSLICSIILAAIILFIFRKSSACLLYCLNSSIIAFVIYYVIFYYFEYPKNVEVNFKKMSEGEDLSNITIKFNSEENYIIVKTNNAEGKWAWKAIKDIHNEKENILIFVANRKMILVPKRVFATEEELNETWNLIMECYDKSK